MNPPRVVAISPGDHLRPVDRWPWFRALASAGLRTLLVREPHLDVGEIDALVLNTWASYPRLVLHDRHPRARHYGTPVHLPAHGDDPPSGIPWSRSCHTAEEVDRAFAQGAGWVTLSPVWAPSSKPADTREPLGLARFLAIAAGRPVLALGGVDLDRAATLASHGYGAAVCGALFGQPDPAAAAAACAALIGAWRGAYSPVSSDDSGSPTGNSRSS